MTDPAAKVDGVPSWYKRRGYPHFDRPMTPDQAIRLVKDEQAVAERAFLPFISFDIEHRRFKKHDDGTRRIDVKQRPVAFASHADSHIFAYYAHLLKQPYEALLNSRGISDNVIAYRRFEPPKCNIHFARDAFLAIEQRGACEAVALDIEGFFDSIPHRPLKRQWSEVLGVATLPDDHYAVFKAITRWAKVDREDLFRKLNVGRRRRENWNRRETLCSTEEFRREIRGGGLIQQGYAVQDGEPVGIPQGSPISALLSNLVMFEVDCAVAAAADAHGVFYRRYCDDILFVGSHVDVAFVEATFKTELRKLGLLVNEAKIKRSKFFIDADEQLRASEPLQYLGFTFDGLRILVRPQTVSRYLRRMKQGVRSAKRAAKAASQRGGSRRLRRQELYARFSHLGPTRAMVRQSSGPNLRNNFHRYVTRSSRVMERDEIKRQLRRHWDRLQAEIQIADRDM